MVVGRNKHVGSHTNTYPFATTATPRLHGAELCKQGGSSGGGGWWFVCVDSGRMEMGPVSRNLLGRDRPHHHNPGNLAPNLHRVPGGRKPQRTRSAGIPGENGTARGGSAEVKRQFRTSLHPNSPSFQRENCLGNSPLWGILLYPGCFFLMLWPSPKHTLCFQDFVSRRRCSPPDNAPSTAQITARSLVHLTSGALKPLFQCHLQK